MISLSRSKNARRLIENENLSTFVKCFEDFNTLLQANRQFSDDGIWINIKLIFIGKAFELGAGLGQRWANEHAPFSTKNNIFENSEWIH